MTHFLKRAILCSTLVLNEKKGGKVNVEFK
nr:MAG TPA: hypothetical protein [Caudoviricetes sp.]